MVRSDIDRCEYAIEVYRKSDDKFLERVDVYESCDGAKKVMMSGILEVDEKGEYLGILEIQYDRDGDEIGTEKLSL